MQQQPTQTSQEGQQQLAPQQPQPATSPYVDIYETPDSVIVFADLPGCAKEDIQIEGSEQTLHISAERSQEPEEAERAWQRERLSQKVERTVTLPSVADFENAEATCDNGVCKVTLPKSEKSRQTQIGVE